MSFFHWSEYPQTRVFIEKSSCDGLRPTVICFPLNSADRMEPGIVSLHTLADRPHLEYLSKFCGVRSSVHWLEAVARVHRLSVSRALSFSSPPGSCQHRSLSSSPLCSDSPLNCDSWLRSCHSVSYASVSQFPPLWYFPLPFYSLLLFIKWLISRSQQAKRNLHHCKTYLWIKMPPTATTHRLTMDLGLRVWSACITKQGSYLKDQVSFQLVLRSPMVSSGKSPWNGEHILYHWAGPCSWQKSHITAVLFSLFTQVIFLIRTLSNCLWIKTQPEMYAESGIRGGSLEVPVSVKSSALLY